MVNGIQILYGGSIKILSICSCRMRVGLRLETAHQLLEAPIAYQPSKELKRATKRNQDEKDSQQQEDQLLGILDVQHLGF